MIEDNVKFLITSSTKLLDYEEDDDIQVENIKEKTNEEQYESLLLIDSIGKNNFKEVYNDSINFIKSMPIDKQKILCSNILLKVEEEYGIFFMTNIDLNTKEDFDEVYLFLEFIEFNYIEFISNIWKFLDFDLRKDNVKQYCLNNSDKIIKEIDKQLETNFLQEIILDFLRTNIKSVIIDLFIKMTEKSKTEIRIFLEGGM